MQTTDANLYESDIASIAASTTDNTDSNQFDVSDVEVVALEVKGNGANASSAGNLVVSVAVSLDGTNYNTVSFHSITVPIAGTSVVRQTELINVSGVQKLKIDSIQNTDPTYAVQNVNVRIGKRIL